VGKYDPLRDYLAGQNRDEEMEMTFGEVEELVGRLPNSARVHRPWWANGSKVEAQAWRAAGWHVQEVNIRSEQVTFARGTVGQSPSVRRTEAARQFTHAEVVPERPAVRPSLPQRDQPVEAQAIIESVSPVQAQESSSGDPPEEALALGVPERHASSLRGYLAGLHLPLVVVLFLLCVILGALGFGLRPGTDKPPPVSSSRIQLYVYQKKSPTARDIGPVRVSVDETLVQKTASTVQVQLDLFGSFSTRGQVRWDLLTGTSQSQPYSCPDPYSYLGTANSDPVAIQNGRLTIGGRAATPAVIANFTGRHVTKAASDTLGLAGQAPGEIPANVLAPLGEINLCWIRNAPLAFDGEYATAALPTVSAYPYGNARFTFNATRSLYFENPLQSAQPITAEYSLQAGSLPARTDPFGWHWSDNQGGLIQLTALNIPQSQHETYLGFISGVIFGVAGGAFVSLLQETLAPLRRPRTPPEIKISRE
jgi:hypothetical protein